MKKAALAMVTVVLALLCTVMPASAGGPPAVFSIQNNWGEVVTAAVGPIEGFAHTDEPFTLSLHKWDERSAWMSEITKLNPEPGQSVMFEGGANNYGKVGHLGDDITLTVLPLETADYIDWRLYIMPVNESTYTEITDWSKPIVLSGAGAQQGYNSWSFALTATNNIAPVPEPGSFVALGSGIMGLAGITLRKRRAQ